MAKSVTVLEKCYAISEGDRQDNTKKTYRFDSTWFWNDIDPILHNNFSCTSLSKICIFLPQCFECTFIIPNL